MSFRPGELDQLITIEREQLTDDGTGGQDLEWVTVVTDLWAKVRPLSGNEQERYDQVNAMAMATFVIRYRDDLLPTDRIVWNGEPYNIRYIPPVSGREMYLAINAERGVAQ